MADHEADRQLDLPQNHRFRDKEVLEIGLWGREGSGNRLVFKTQAKNDSHFSEPPES